MKNSYFLFVFTLFLTFSALNVSGEEPLTVHGYYGEYDTTQKKSGFPPPSLGEPVIEEWTSPVPAKRYHIGVLFPHLKDDYWTAANYGIVSYAKTLGVDITLYSAGAYINFGDQRQQLFNLARKTNVDGIILSTVDYMKMDRFIEDVREEGTPVIALINDIHAPAIQAKAMVSYFDAGYKAGEFVMQDSSKKDIKVAFFPGPEDTGWAENMYEGFMAAIAELNTDGRTIDVAPPLYGDTRPEVQRMRLSVLLGKERNRGMDYIVGNAVAAAEAVTYLKEHKDQHPDAKIVSTYITASLYDLIQQGYVKAAPYDQPMNICRIALDMMVRVLNGETPGKDFPFRAGPDYIMLTEENIAQYGYETLFGPRDFQPVVN